MSQKPVPGRVPRLYCGWLLGTDVIRAWVKELSDIDMGAEDILGAEAVPINKALKRHGGFLRASLGPDRDKYMVVMEVFEPDPTKGYFTEVEDLESKPKYPEDDGLKTRREAYEKENPCLHGKFSEYTNEIQYV